MPSGRTMAYVVTTVNAQTTNANADDDRGDAQPGRVEREVERPGVTSWA